MNTASLETVVATLKAKYGPDVMAIAAMSHLCRNLLHQLGQANGITMRPTVRTLDRCIESHLIEHDIHPHTLNAALRDLQQAGGNADHTTADAGLCGIVATPTIAASVSR